MSTLADATRALAEKVQYAAEGVATGGSATTLIDTARIEPDDQFTNGTIWLLSGNNIGKSAIISGWVLSTHTFTFATLTLLCAAGDLYAVTSMDYPKYVMIQAINRVLAHTYLPKTDVTLVTVADQEEYSLPTGVTDIRRIEIAENIATPYDYVPHYNWREIEGKLRFDIDFAPDTAGYKIRLTYVAPQAALASDVTAFDNRIALEWLAWQAAVILFRQRIRKTDGKEPYILALYNDAVNMSRMQENPPRTVPKDAHLAGY
jgi:hypothetical protein